MVIHCETLGSRASENTTATVKDFIKNMKGGRAAYRASPLKLALRNGRAKGVLLRCPLPRCSHNSSPVSYRSLGPNLMCPGGHWPKEFMQCTGCGEPRSEIRSECRGCGERFR